MRKIILPAIVALAFIAGLNAKEKLKSVNLFANCPNVSNVSTHLRNNASDSLLTIDQLKANLTLTDEQVTAIDSILTNAANQINNINSMDSNAAQQRQQIISDAYKSIEYILTADQQTKFEALIAQQKNPGY